MLIHESNNIELDAQFVQHYVSIYKHLHKIPELSFMEYKTSEFIVKALQKLGISPFRCADTGVVAVIENGCGPTVAYRADIDALPIKEETGASYASTASGVLPDGQPTPIMHACGHDTHIVSGLAAAQLLLQHTHQWAGTVVLIFQPGEEMSVGAAAMINDGLWERAPLPDVVLAQHVIPLPTQCVLIAPGNMAALCNFLRITVHGKQAHGAQPEVSQDPVVAAASMVVRLQTIVSREISPLTSAVVTIGTFHAGVKENIIPSSAEFTVNTRTPNEEVRAQVIQAIRRIVNGEAQASGCPEPTIEETLASNRLYNDLHWTNKVKKGLVGAFGEAHILPRTLGMISEDAGWLADAIKVPMVFWGFGANLKSDFDDGSIPPGNHSPFFKPDPQQAVITGSRAAYAAIISALCNDKTCQY